MEKDDTFNENIVTPLIPVTDIELIQAIPFDILIAASKQLTAIIEPTIANDKTINWMSSDPTKASVNSSGLVTANVPGTATITATTSNGITASVTVTVVNTLTLVSNIILTSDTILTSPNTNIIVGGTSVKLTASIEPEDASDRNVTWTSSDPSKASVDRSGLVTAMVPGTATITATTFDAKTAIVEFTVISLVVDMILKPNRLTIKPKTKKKITAIIYPSTASDKDVTWTSSNTRVATVDQKGFITSKVSGKTIITAKAKDGSGRTAKSIITVGIPVKSVKLPGTLIIKMGSSKLIKRTILPIKRTILPIKASDRGLVWKSDNPNIASVNRKGVVNAINKGRTIITATSLDGTSKSSKIKIIIK